MGSWLWSGQTADFIKAYDWYEARLRTNNAVDFDDLLSLCVAVLRQEVRTLDAVHMLPITLSVCIGMLR